MIWELAGDYAFDAAGVLYGDTLTTTIDASSRRPVRREAVQHAPPTQTIDVDVPFGGFALGDTNYPITPKMKLTNSSTTTIPGGTKIEFDYGTSAPGIARPVRLGRRRVKATQRNNVGGLKGDFQHVTLTLPSWQTVAPGASVQLDFVYYLPTSTPSNWTVTFGGSTYSLAGDLARGTTVVQPGHGDARRPRPRPPPRPRRPTPTPSPTPTPGGGSCSAAAWSATAEYGGGTTVSHGSHTMEGPVVDQGRDSRHHR